MQFDTALNLVWLTLGLIALGSVVLGALYGAPGAKKRSIEKRPIWLHIVVGALIVTSLFPYISATDDVLRTQHYAAQHERGPAGRHSRIDNLMRLYEAMDNPTLCEARQVVLVFLFVSLIFNPAIRAVSRLVPHRAGRSPPVLATA